MNWSNLLKETIKVSKSPTTTALFMAAFAIIASQIVIYYNSKNNITNNSVIYFLICASLLFLIVGIFLYYQDKKGAYRQRMEPDVNRGGKENKMFETKFGYKVIEHYNGEHDPKISFITAIKGDNGTFTDWFRVKDEKDPIESRFYIMEGAATFELYHAKEKKTSIEPDKRYDLVKDESIIVPDSWWCRFKLDENKVMEGNVLKIIVLCMPRWKEDSHDVKKDIRELVP